MTLTIELPDEQREALTAVARARGVSAEEYLREAVAELLRSSSAEPPIWETLAGNSRRVPLEDLAALPHDGASQIDHYVYGVPKREL